MGTIRIVFTDLDGTLLNSTRDISPANRHCLEELGRCGITRVIATGRSLFSYGRLRHLDIPADYIIFSNGAGIMDLRTGRLLHRNGMKHADVVFIAATLRDEEVDFMVHDRIPDNHRFVYCGNVLTNSDFARRIELYRDHAEEYVSPQRLPPESAQVVAIFPGDIDHFHKVGERLSRYQITRTTSPLDGVSIWMEILPPQITKGSSAAWLCRHLGLEAGASLGVGNDFNDESLLRYTGRSFVVAEAPEQMRRLYSVTRSSNLDGFSEAAGTALT